MQIVANKKINSLFSSLSGNITRTLSLLRYLLPFLARIHNYYFIIIIITIINSLIQRWQFTIAKTKANEGQLFTKRIYKIKEIHDIYKNPSPQIKALQILQLQSYC